MIKEDYVNADIAKMLEEKGFPVKEVQTWYCEFDGYPDKNIINDRQHPMITHQMVTKWLREMYDIHVVPRKDFFNGTYTGMIYDGRRENVFDKEDYIALVGCETYEEAVEASLRYVLEKMI